jgi:DNA-entry nuclease
MSDHKAKNSIIRAAVTIAMSASVLFTGCTHVTADDIRQQYIDEQAVKEKTDKVGDYANGVKEDISDGAREAADNVKDTASDLKDTATDKAVDLKDTAEEKAGDLKDVASEKASDAKEGAKEVAGNVADDAKEGAQTFMESIEDDWDSVLDALTKENDGEGRTYPATRTQNEQGYIGKAPEEIITPGFDISQVGPYTGTACVDVNGNVPYFTQSEITTQPFELYSPLDSLGRSGTGYANICTEIMPTGERADIGMIKPTGWHQAKYDILKTPDNPAGYCQNRGHIVAFCLSGENANPQNLFTSTRYLNAETGMEKYELQVLSYVRSTKHHVLYRVTPVFEGNNLLATGVLMEAQSVEDNGIRFCKFLYNIQPGIVIDYATGENWAA